MLNKELLAAALAKGQANILVRRVKAIDEHGHNISFDILLGNGDFFAVDRSCGEWVEYKQIERQFSKQQLQELFESASASSTDNRYTLETYNKFTFDVSRDTPAAAILEAEMFLREHGYAGTLYDGQGRAVWSLEFDHDAEMAARDNKIRYKQSATHIA